MFRLFLLLTSFAVFAQDSTLAFLKSKIQFDLSGSAAWQSKVIGGDKEILLPGYIKETRIRYNKSFNPDWKYAQDNPLYHAAYYIGGHTKIHIAKGFSIYTTLFAEHRGFSYGVNSTSNIMIFPQMKAAVNRKIKIGKHNLWIFGSAGNQINPRLYEGLTIYNLYQQGHNYKFRYGKFQLHYMELSDLKNGIGLFIDDSYDAVSSLEELNLGEKWKMDIRSGMSYNPFLNTAMRIHYNLSAGVYLSGKIRLYGQMNYRPNIGYFKEFENFAALLGVRTERKSARVRLMTQTELRYYGAGFNYKYKSTDVYYRERNTPQINYANTVGKHFYPLLMFDRPFSQWAVYTEYQDAYPMTVGGAGILVDLKIKLHDELTLMQQYDLNYIYGTRNYFKADVIQTKESSFLYPFYNVGLAWEPLEDNWICVGLTNKGMNLDVHYPTHYYFRYPAFMFSLRRELKANWMDGHD